MSKARVLAWLWAVAGAGSVWAGPRFEWLPPTNATWGPYYGFPELVVTSRFRNAGTAPLRLANARSTCTCTTLSAAPETLAPGATGQIIMRTKQTLTIFPTLRTFGYVMTTDDPDRPVVVWSAVAEFRPGSAPLETLDEAPSASTPPATQHEADRWVEPQRGDANEELPAAGKAGVAAFHLPADSRARERAETIARELDTTTVLRVRGAKKVYGCALDAEVELWGDASLVRVVVVDQTGQVYLALESYSALHGTGTHDFERHCEETYALPGIKPAQLAVQVEGARVRLKRVHWQTRQARGRDDNRLAAQQAAKMAQLNKHAGTWKAGLTPQGGLRYAEKCRMFGGAAQSGALPNVQGFEHYKSGVFILRTNPPRESTTHPPAWPRRMNWQLRHGYRLLMPVKNQGLHATSGAYTLAGALECNLNIFYNKHLDVTLAEEDVLTCSGALTPAGFDLVRAVQYCYESGIVMTDCVVRAAAPGYNLTKCADWKQHAVRSAGAYLTNNISNDELRRLLVRYGVVPAGVPEWQHMLVVVGWETNGYSDAPVWVVRNSYGKQWGEEGYMRLSCDASAFAPVVVFTTPYMWGRRQITTDCNDSDGDHYCAWGIAPALPRNCCTCNCRSVQDFDDYDPQQGPHYPPSP